MLEWVFIDKIYPVIAIAIFEIIKKRNNNTEKCV
jgi:hypothetical protein